MDGYTARPTYQTPATANAIVAQSAGGAGMKRGETSGAENIYRVYHDTDPVPMIPVYPYMHMPYESNAYRMKGVGKLIAPAAHMMAGYTKSVGDCAWSSLPVILPKHSGFQAASDWLADASKDSGPCIMFSSNALQLILSALDWIVKRLGDAAALTVNAGATVIDALARLLYNGALLSIQIAETIRNLLATAMCFLGRQIADSTNTTVAFIQYVLGMLFRFAATMARRAIDRPEN
jgi:hypothetical protein